jgi:hypothetical protein
VRGYREFFSLMTDHTEAGVTALMAAAHAERTFRRANSLGGNCH